MDGETDLKILSFGLRVSSVSHWKKLLNVKVIASHISAFHSKMLRCHQC